MSRWAPIVALVVGAVAGCATDDPALGTSSAALVDPASFVLPSLSTAERARIVHDYDALDPDDLVPRGLLEDAILYFDVNQAAIPKPTWLTVADFARHSGHDRFWMIDLTTGAVEPHKVAHGDGSDPDNNGYADVFGNEDGSHRTSLGFYLTGEIYDGTHPHSMRLDGLSADGSPNGMANTNVRSRLIVVHEASYVNDGSSSQQGRSNGCLALDSSIEAGVVDRIYGGSLIYAAITPLNTPVGRSTCGDATCDGTEDEASCPDDCAEGAGPDVAGDGDDSAGGADAGGCAATGNRSGVLLAVMIVGAVRRRRRPKRRAA